MRIVKKAFVLIPFLLLSSCSFSYPRAILFESAKGMLDSFVSSFNEERDEKSRYGLGYKRKEKEDDEVVYEETFFVDYDVLSDSSFRFDYYEKINQNGSCSETYLTVFSDDSVLIKDNLTDESRSFDAKKDKDLQPFFDFVPNILMKCADSFIMTAQTMMNALADTSKENSLRTYSASSSDSSQLSLHFTGVSLAIPKVYKMIEEEVAYDSFEIGFEGRYINQVKLIYERGEDGAILGESAFYFRWG